MRNPRKAIFPNEIYSRSLPAMRGRNRRAHAYCEAYPSISSLARQFEGGKIGVYRLVRVAIVKRSAQIELDGKTAKVRGALDYYGD